MKKKAVPNKETHAEIKITKMAAEIRARANKPTDAVRQKLLVHSVNLVYDENGRDSETESTGAKLLAKYRPIASKLTRAERDELMTEAFRIFERGDSAKKRPRRP